MLKGPQIYQPKFGPSYRISYSCSIGLLCGTLLSVSSAWFFVAKEDKKDDSANSGSDATPEEQTDNQKAVEYTD